jgi:tRNA-dihydrouridine synthase
LHSRAHARADVRRQADYEAVGAVARQVRIPVLVNGDVFTPQDALRALAVSGCRACSRPRRDGKPLAFQRDPRTARREDA